MEDYKENEDYDISSGSVYTNLCNIVDTVPTDDVDKVLDFHVLKFIAKRLAFNSSISNGVIAFGPIHFMKTDSTEIKLILRFLSEHQSCHVKDNTKYLLMALQGAYHAATSELRYIGPEDDILRKTFEFCILASTLQLEIDYDYKLNQEILDYYGKTNEELATSLKLLYSELTQGESLFCYSTDDRYKLPNEDAV